MKSANENPLDVQVAGTHYKQMKIQPVEFIHANEIGFCEATAIKYLCRWKRKGGIQDLEKAKHFIDVLIELETRNLKAPEVEVIDGPYCNRCDQLADFTYAFGLNDELKDFICSNCAANAEIDTTNWDLLGRL